MANQINVKPIVPVLGAAVGVLIARAKKKSIETTVLYGITGAGTAYFGSVAIMATPKLSTLIETKNKPKLATK